MITAAVLTFQSDIGDHSPIRARALDFVMAVNIHSEVAVA